MHTSVVLLLLALAGGTVARELFATWKVLDIRAPIAILRDVPLAGFEFVQHGSFSGDVPIYICQRWVNTPANDTSYGWTFGKLLYRPQGDLVCYTVIRGREVGLPYNYQNRKWFQVLTTPPECYSWIPYDRSNGFPSGWPMKRRSLVSTGPVQELRICRVSYEANDGYVIPGYMGGDGNCWYPHHGVKITAEHVEILAWNEYAYANVDACTEPEQ